MSNLCNLHKTAVKYIVSSNKLFELCYDENIRFFTYVDEHGFVLQEIEQKTKNFLTDKELFELINSEELENDPYLRERNPEDYFFQEEDKKEVEKIAKLLTQKDKKKIQSHWEVKRICFIELANHVVQMNKEVPLLFKTVKGKKSLNASFIAEHVLQLQSTFDKTKDIKNGYSSEKIYEIVSKGIKNKEIATPVFN